jgi:hypothetical protein
MRWTIIILMALGLGSCSDGDRTNDGTGYIIGDTVLAWETNADSMIMKRDSTVPDTAITMTRIINGLNGKYPEVHVDFLRQSNDTAYTKVPDADFLGNQMGSAGAMAWFADAVINITSVPGINYVSFEMEMQNHAASAVIGREKYNDWKKVK